MKNNKQNLNPQKREWWPLLLFVVISSLSIAIFLPLKVNYEYGNIFFDNVKSFDAIYKDYEKRMTGSNASGSCDVLFFFDTDPIPVFKALSLEEYSMMDELSPGTKVTLTVMKNGRWEYVLGLNKNTETIIDTAESKKQIKRELLGWDIFGAFWLFPVLWVIYKIIRKEVDWWPFESDGNKKR